MLTNVGKPLTAGEYGPYSLRKAATYCVALASCSHPPRFVLGQAGLLFPVLLGVSLHRFFSVPSRVNGVRPGCVSVVRRLLVKSALVVFGRLPVMAGGMCKMF
jgi:hypothetical protein